MKHSIGIELVDSRGKPFSTLHTTRGLEYDDGELNHDEAYKLLEDAVVSQHEQTLKRVSVKQPATEETPPSRRGIHVVPDSAISVTGNTVNGRPQEEISREELQDFDDLPWRQPYTRFKQNKFSKDGEGGWIFKDQRDPEMKRLAGAIMKRYQTKKAPITVYCGDSQYKVQVEGDFIRRTPIVNGR
jgi:hypothetical protein